MQNRLVILGACGHGKVIADLALRCGYEDIVFLDDNATGECMGFPIVGTCEDAVRTEFADDDFVIAIGNNRIRERIATEHDLNWVSLVHPTAILGSDTSIGKGSVIAAYSVVNSGASVGEHCIINTGAIVEHDCALADFVHISPKTALGGTVCVGRGTHVGIGASVKNNITICGGCTIGAGAVIVKDIEEDGTYIGVPARKIK